MLYGNEQLSKHRLDFSNLARVKLGEVCRSDTSCFADIERVVDLLGEWMMRLSDPIEKVPVAAMRIGKRG